MPKDGELKEDDYGFLKWKQVEDGAGYWVRQEDEERVKDRTPLACPACGSLLDHWKASYYNRYGVCNDCYYNYLDKPEEGDESFRDMTRTREERAIYCANKIKERKS